MDVIQPDTAGSVIIERAKGMGMDVIARHEAVYFPGKPPVNMFRIDCGASHVSFRFGGLVSESAHIEPALLTLRDMVNARQDT